jgi:hypothetical protein
MDVTPQISRSFLVGRLESLDRMLALLEWDLVDMDKEESDLNYSIGNLRAAIMQTVMHTPVNW